MRILTGLRVGLVLLAVGGGLALGQEPDSAAASRPRAATADPGGALSELVLIAPGTQVDKNVPPAGAT
jgi:hypothetical protein